MDPLVSFSHLAIVAKVSRAVLLIWLDVMPSGQPSGTVKLLEPAVVLHSLRYFVMDYSANGTSGASAANRNELIRA